MRLSEHQAEVAEGNKQEIYSLWTQSIRTRTDKSAISDHVARANHVIDWDEAKILGREHDKKSREVREAIEIRRRGAKTLNMEEGTYLLSHVYMIHLSRNQEMWKRLFPAGYWLPVKVDQMVILMKSPEEVRRNINFVSKKPDFVTHNYIFDWTIR